MLGFFEQEPHRLDAVSGVDGAAGYGVDKFTVWSYTFQQCLQLGVYEIFLQRLNRPCNLCIERLVGYGCAYARSGVDENHGERVALGGYRFAILGGQYAGSGHEAMYVVKHLQRLERIFLVARSYGVFRHGYGCEALREHISAHAYGCAVGFHLEVHASALVGAVLLYEVDAAP